MLASWDHEHTYIYVCMFNEGGGGERERDTTGGQTRYTVSITAFPNGNVTTAACVGIVCELIRAERDIRTVGEGLVVVCIGVVVAVGAAGAAIPRPASLSASSSFPPPL